MEQLPYEISEMWEYEYARSRGVEPIMGLPRLSIYPPLRRQIQWNLFGSGHSPEENEKFFKFVWKHRPHYCEECMKPLHHYSAVYCSHILTRGAHPEMAHDPRNINILCFEHHNQWEHATTRKTMRIYNKNLITIKLLESEYNYGY